MRQKAHLKRDSDGAGRVHLKAIPEGDAEGTTEGDAEGDL
jgi:hypothetical protein